MKKRTKLLAGLLAAIMALCAIGLGFSQWSSGITASGTVSAEGKWDVAVAHAAISRVSTGTAVEAEPVTLEPTGNAVIYPIQLAIRDLDNWYVLQVDDLHGQSTALTAAELAEYNGNLSLSYGKGAICYYASGIRPDKTATFQMKVTDPDTVTVSDHGSYLSINQSLENTDNGASVGKVVGYAILKLWGGSSSSLVHPSNEHLHITYASAQKELANGVSKTIYPAAISEDKAAVAYAPVSFSLPGAWAEYAVTIVNNGSVNANLSDYTVDTSVLDENVFSVAVPTFGEDEMLAPGERCTFHVVVMAADGTDGVLDAQADAFTITLRYVQDVVESAPAVNHSHGGV